MKEATGEVSGTVITIIIVALLLGIGTWLFSGNNAPAKKWIENVSLSEAMKKLSPREQSILQMRFFEGKTKMEVAALIGISQAQVSRLEKNALRIMRNYLSE